MHCALYLLVSSVCTLAGNAPPPVAAPQERWERVAEELAAMDPRPKRSGSLRPRDGPHTWLVLKDSHLRRRNAGVWRDILAVDGSVAQVLDFAFNSASRYCYVVTSDGLFVLPPGLEQLQALDRDVDARLPPGAPTSVVVSEDRLWVATECSLGWVHLGLSFATALAAEDALPCAGPYILVRTMGGEPLVQTSCGIYHLLQPPLPRSPRILVDGRVIPDGETSERARGEALEFTCAPDPARVLLLRSIEGTQEGERIGTRSSVAFEREGAHTVRLVGLDRFARQGPGTLLHASVVPPPIERVAPWAFAALALALAGVLARSHPPLEPEAAARGMAARFRQAWRGELSLVRRADATDNRSTYALARAAWIALLAVAVIATAGVGRSLAVASVAEPSAPDSSVVHALLLALALALELRLAWLLLRPGARPLAIDLAPFRFLIIVLALELVACTVWLQPLTPTRAALSLAYAFGAFAAFVLFGPALLAPIPRRALRAADFALFNLCLCVLGSELVLRVYSRHTASPVFAADDLGAEERRLVATSQLGELHYGFPCNARGQYDTDVALAPDHPRLVACIGDSFSVGKVPHHYHFTTVAERELAELEIYNIGFGGASPTDYAWLLQSQALPLRPELVVIDIFVGNDLELRDQVADERSSLDTVLDARKSRLWKSAERYVRLRDERARLRAQGASPKQKAAAPSAPVTSVEGLVALYPWLVDPLLERPGHSREAFLEIECNRALDSCADRPEVYARLFAKLEDMLALAGDTPLAVMLIPDEFQLEDALWRAVRSSTSEVELDRDAPQKRIGAWLAERGVPYLDLLPILRAEPRLEDGAYHLYHLQDTHFNARGNEVVGRALAAFVSERTGAPRSESEPALSDAHTQR